MERLFDLEKADFNIYNEILTNLNKQRLEDLQKIHEKYNGGELEDKKDQVAHDYDFNMEKLAFIPELSGRALEIQKKFMEMALYIDDLDINKGNKLDAILTFGATVSKVPTHVELLDNESAYILCTSLIGLPLEDYEAYGSIVSNPAVLSAVKAKTSDMYERRGMIYDMFDYCDEVAYDDMPVNEYNQAIGDCLSIVNNYQIKDLGKTK